jgi:exonuclease III
MMNSSIRFTFVSCNVRGLGNPKKCDLVKELIINNLPDLVLLQETKLDNLNIFKSSSFLPAAIQSYTTLDAINASRGLLTAWNPNKLKLISSFTKSYSITSQFESEANAALFWVSNIYGPSSDEERPFLF